MCSPINRLVPALLIAFALVPSQARAEEIIIGARGDARPFIWEDAVTGQHLGFLWDICTEATRRAKFQIAPQSIGARERRLFLTAGAGGFDLLCDPTTVTLARLQRFAEQDSLRHLSFSPIVFVANGTYVYQSDEKSNGRGKLPEDIGKLKAGCKALRASAAPSNRTGSGGEPQRKQEPWIRLLPATDSGDEGRFEVWGYVTGSTIGEKIALEATQRPQDDRRRLLICPESLNSHDEAAREFCAGNLARYFGDADIIKASIDAYRARPGTTCVQNYQFATDGTYEPYAFVLSSRRVRDFPERFTYALYGMFSDGTVDRLYAGHFPGIEKSLHLGTLFRINNIPPGVDLPKDKASKDDIAN